MTRSIGVWGAPRGWHWGCEEDLSNGRRCLLHRGPTDIHTRGHGDSMTESAQWADSVKTIQHGLVLSLSSYVCMSLGLYVLPPGSPHWRQIMLSGFSNGDIHSGYSRGSRGTTILFLILNIWHLTTCTWAYYKKMSGIELIFQPSFS